MAIETWFPALLGYLIPIGLFLLAWGGMEAGQARRAAALGALAVALGALGYFAVGFAFHLGGAKYMSDLPGLQGLDDLHGVSGWGLIGLKGFFLARAEGFKTKVLVQNGTHVGGGRLNHAIPLFFRSDRRVLSRLC